MRNKLAELVSFVALVVKSPGLVAIIVTLLLLGISAIDFSSTKLTGDVVEAAQVNTFQIQRQIKIDLQTLSATCDTETGNLVYTLTNPRSHDGVGGVWGIPNGCHKTAR